MLKVIQSSIINPIQVAGEVNKALRDHSVVVVTKRNIGANYQQFVYDIYAGTDEIANEPIDISVVPTKAEAKK
jgi:stage V sporulation protein SpoVS